VQVRAARITTRMNAHTRPGGNMHRRVLYVAVALALAATTTWAHMMPAQQGTLNIIGNAVFAALSLPVSALDGVDDNADGRLSRTELAAHTTAIQAAVSSRVRFTNGDTPGRVDLVMPMGEPDERDSTSMLGSTHVLVLMKASFDAPPMQLRIDADLFGPAPNERQFTFKATRGKESEVIVLTPRRTTHTFFRTPLQVLRDYVGVGVDHILFGTDHLLFLLTLIVAAAGWRYWFGVLTSFTVAHSIALTASLFGVVHLAAAVVEPLIAASIVLMAWLNLRQRVIAPTRRIVIVFACGLLHGIGFAGSMADMGLHGAYRVTSIVGFNVGIELGQALFLLAMLVVGVVWRRVMALPAVRERAVSFASLTPVGVVSVAALLLGSLWLVERVVATGTRQPNALIAQNVTSLR